MSYLLTISFILFNACFAWVIFQAIQPGQMFGSWQRVLDKAYSIHPMLELFLGGCYKCFAHLWGIIGYWFYLLVQYHFCWMGWWNTLLYFGYVPAVIVMALLIGKLLDEPSKTETDGL